MLPIMQGSPPPLVPPKLDWDRPPWNRWAFQHVREILPTIEVWRGHGPVRALPRADVDLDGLAVVDSAGVPTTLLGLLDETYTDGFLVFSDQDGFLLYRGLFSAAEMQILLQDIKDSQRRYAKDDLTKGSMTFKSSIFLES